MTKARFFKAMERKGDRLTQLEKQGKKKVVKPTKPKTPQTLAFEARTQQSRRRKALEDAIQHSPNRDGLPLESAKQLQRYMSKKAFRNKPKLRDLDTAARSYFEKLLEKDMGAVYKMELARLEEVEKMKEGGEEQQTMEVKETKEDHNEDEEGENPQGYDVILAREYEGDDEEGGDAQLDADIFLALRTKET